ncbi:SusC/RagA family TonB-linked outer membrane protein [Niabella sp. 22666]|uniref:SusC/RagA family TonB-linked outer membrane protein n=1 Tax=Niabella sp. 22666 TaxID=3453954 RepID=UPI003F837B57
MKKNVLKGFLFPSGALLKTLLVMKLAIAIVLFTAFQVQAGNASGQGISLNLKNTDVKTVLTAIEKSTRYRFIYNYDLSGLKAQLDFKAKEASLTEVLNKLLEGNNLAYKKLNRNLIAIVSTIDEEKRQIEVTGRVTDTKGDPVPGASVTEKGTSNGVVTNDNGQYKITVGDGAVLVVSAVGFQQQDIIVGTQTEINVALETSVSSLNEVIVIGYGTQRKKDLTGSVAVVDMKELKAQPAASPLEALQGKAAGVQIVNDGSPGATPQIRIRGFSTINNNDPLFIIDGMPYQGKLSWLSSNDIESMQVLKDASAASIYGSRANNGVVIITTKKGRSGKPQVNLDIYYGSQNPNRSRFPTYLTPQQFADYLFTGYRNAGLDPTQTDYYGTNANQPTLPEYLLAGATNGQKITAAMVNPSLYKYTTSQSTFYQITKANQQGTDWFRTITQNAPMQNYQLTVSGGSEKSNYAVSGGYLNQDGIVRHTGFKRYTIRANTNFTLLNDRLQLGENMQYSRTQGVGFATNVNTPGSYMGEGSPIGWAYRIQTIIPVYDIMGNFAGSRGNLLGNAENPLAVLVRGKDNLNTSNQFFGSAFADLKILEGLNLRTTYGVRYETWNGVSVTYPNPERAEGSYDNHSFSENMGWGTDWTWSNTLTYKKQFNENHELTILAGTEAIKANGRILRGSANGFYLMGDMNYYYMNTANSSPVAGNDIIQPSSLFSILGRVDYSLMDKYLISATLRRDGSSRFGSNNQYGNFPAASVAWRLSNEEFFKSVTWLNDLKLRAGYGVTGNQSIRDFEYLKRLQASLNNSFYPINGSLSSGVWIANYDNKDVKWEQAQSVNLGIDFTLFNNKLGGSFDVYNKKTKDLLYVLNLPAQAIGGGQSPFVNLGNMTNKGFEIALNYHYSSLAPVNPFSLDVGVNLSRNINELTKLADGVKRTFLLSNRSVQPSVLQAGLPFGAFYGYKVEGIFKSAEEIAGAATQPGAHLGGFRYADVSGPNGTPDGIINDDDRTYIGNPHPDFIYGFNLNARYYNFDVSLFFNGSQGNDLFDMTRLYTDLSLFDGAVSDRMLDAWSPTNTGSNIPAPYRDRPAIEMLSNSYFVQDGSYLKLKLLQIGYNFKFKGALQDKVKNCRLYVSGTNLFTVTKYTGLDPEVTSSPGSTGAWAAPGVDMGMYPMSRQFLVGLNVTF